MNVTLSRKFQVAPYEMHEIMVSLSEADFINLSEDTMANLITMRNLAHKMLVAEMFIYHALPKKEEMDAINSRTAKIQQALLEE